MRSAGDPGSRVRASAAGSTREQAALTDQNRRTAHSPPPFELHQTTCSAHTAQEETNGECLQGHSVEHSWGGAFSKRAAVRMKRFRCKWGIVVRELSTPKWLRKMVVWKLLSCPGFSRSFTDSFDFVGHPALPLRNPTPYIPTFPFLSFCFSVSPPLSHLQKFLFLSGSFLWAFNQTADLDGQTHCYI